MRNENDITREGETDIAARYHKSYEEEIDRRIDAVCLVIVIGVIAIFAIALYRCPGCSREKFVEQQAVQLEAAEGGAK